MVDADSVFLGRRLGGVSMIPVFFLLFIAGHDPQTFDTDGQCFRAGIESGEDFACRRIDPHAMEPEVGP